MLNGFGAGAVELQTLVERYVVTITGLIPLGSTRIETVGGKMPGMLVPLGAGAAVGNVAKSAAISGAGNVLQEAGPEGLDGAEKRTAKAIAKAYKERGWIPEFGGGKLTVLGKWMHDFTAENRFESDYFTLTGAWKF
jgi:hypothetical protein